MYYLFFVSTAVENSSEVDVYLKRKPVEKFRQYCRFTYHNIMFIRRVYLLECLYGGHNSFLHAVKGTDERIPYIICSYV